MPRIKAEQCFSGSRTFTPATSSAPKNYGPRTAYPCPDCGCDLKTEPGALTRCKKNHQLKNDLRK